MQDGSVKQILKKKSFQQMLEKFFFLFWFFAGFKICMYLNFSISFPIAITHLLYIFFCQ